VAVKPSPPASARRVGAGCRDARETGTSAAEVLAALPTPARRASGIGAAGPVEAHASEHQHQHQAAATNAGSVGLAAAQRHGPAAVARQAPSTAGPMEVVQQPQHLPTPRPALGPAGAANTMPIGLAAQASRAAALAPSSPPQEQKPAVQVQIAAQPPASSPDAGLGERPLVELTHVLNMVAPRPMQGLLVGQASGPSSSHTAVAGKQKPPSVAAELLISSALRMQWPHDRRKVASADAATTCREAAEVLKEAAAQLLGAAAALEGGACPATKPLSCCSESKRRRRTFGGPSPTRAVSPVGGAGPPPQRSSPPVRFAGLRV